MVETPDGLRGRRRWPRSRTPTRAPTRSASARCEDALAAAVGSDLQQAFATAVRERSNPAHQPARSSTRSPAPATEGPRHDLRPRPRLRRIPPGLRAGARAAGVAARRRRPADTPVAAYLKLAEGRPNAFLLESVEGGASRGRYSIIGLDPDLIWRCRGGRAEINRHARSAPYAFAADDRAAAGQPARAGARVPAGGAGGAAADGGRAGRLSRLRHGAPDGAPAGEERRQHRRARGAAAAPDAVRDLRQRHRPADAGRPGAIRAPGSRPRRRGRRRRPRWPRPRRRWSARCRSPPRRWRCRRCRSRRPTSPREGFMAAVERAKEYIRAGDAFQVVPSQRFSVPFALPPFALYRALRRINPAPFLFYPRFRRLRGGRQQPGNPGAPARRHRHHPPARRHPPPRRHARGGPGAGGGTARRPQGARRAPDAARPRPQRCRAGGRDSARCA